MAKTASGMAVHKLKFLELKSKRTYLFIIYNIEEKQKKVVVEKLGEPAQRYEYLFACLPANECRYAVYDFDFMTNENVQKSRIFFIACFARTAGLKLFEITFFTFWGIVIFPVLPEQLLEKCSKSKDTYGAINEK